MATSIMLLILTVMPMLMLLLTCELMPLSVLTFMLRYALGGRLLCRVGEGLNPSLGTREKGFKYLKLLLYTL